VSSPRLYRRPWRTSTTLCIRSHLSGSRLCRTAASTPFSVITAVTTMT